MSKEQLVQRLLCMEGGLDSGRLRTGYINEDEWGRLIQAAAALSETKIFIDDSANISTMEMRSKARRLQAEQGLDLIVVDYLQLMQGRNSENRVQEISTISRELKGLARELNVPVIALSQVSRAVDARTQPCAHALRPERKRIYRARRGYRDLHLPRRGLQRGHGEEEYRRYPCGQAPQRPHRQSSRCISTRRRPTLWIWIQPSDTLSAMISLSHTLDDRTLGLLPPAATSYPPEAPMKGFDGFRAGRQAVVPIPDAFFAILLPQIDNVCELKVTLHLFWLLARREGLPKVVAWSELRGDPALLQDGQDGQGTTAR